MEDEDESRSARFASRGWKSRVPSIGDLVTLEGALKEACDNIESDKLDSSGACQYVSKRLLMQSEVPLDVASALWSSYISVLA